MTDILDLKVRYEEAVRDLDAAMDLVAILRRKLLDAYSEVPEHEPLDGLLPGSTEDYKV